MGNFERHVKKLLHPQDRFLFAESNQDDKILKIIFFTPLNFYVFFRKCTGKVQKVGKEGRTL